MIENKFSKYLTYAFGEIVLVVIGILIALQINTWNELRKEKILEQSYYCKLQEDLELDIAQVNRQIVKTDERLSAANDMLSLLQKEQPKIEDVLGKTQSAISLITDTFRPNNAVFQDLKSTGNMKLLKDEEVKKQITEYYSMIDGMVDVMDTNADGAVALFYKKNDYAEIGWQYLDFVKAGIDTTKVNSALLIPKTFNLEAFTKTLTSDAIFYIGSNSRLKYLYETVLPVMHNMRNRLAKKCMVKPHS